MNDERAFEKVKWLFQSAKKIAADERSAYLDSECGSDLTLRREVEKLLDAHDSGFLDEGALEELADIVADGTGEDGEDQDSLPESISHYRIESRLGKGGMGEVFLATDTILGRKVALKMLPAEFSEDKDRLRRFKQEARTISSLNHPYILTIHEFGQTSEGDQFIASEYVEGETLADYLKNHSPSVSRKLEIAIQIASALEAAHEAGVIHRDIKPENVIVRPDGFVKVLDFGIAKYTRPQASHDSGIQTRPLVDTESGIVIGTASHMSPEQARGDKVDKRTDIFSFGVLLYEVFSGDKPFKGSSAMEVIGEILHKEPKPIEAGAVSSELRSVISKCLEKNRNARYQSARHLAKALGSVGHGIDSREPASEERTQGSFSTGSPRFPASLLVDSALALIVPLIIIAGSFFGAAGIDASEIDSIAVLPFSNMTGDESMEFVAKGLSDDLRVDLAKLDGFKVIASDSVNELAAKDLKANEIGDLLNSDSVLYGSLAEEGGSLAAELKVVRVGSETPIWVRSFTGSAADLVELQNQINTEVLRALGRNPKVDADDSGPPSSPKWNQARLAYLQGRYYFERQPKKDVKGDLAKAEEHLKESTELQPNSSVTWRALSEVYWALENRDPAKPKTRAAAIRALELDPESSEANMQMALVKHKLDWDFSAARPYYLKSLEAGPKNAHALRHYGIFTAQMGDVEGGLNYLRNALEIDPLSYRINRAIGLMLLNLGRYDDAADQFRKTSELYPENTAPLNNLSSALAARGKSQEAIALCRKRYKMIKAEGEGICFADIYAQTEGRENQAKEILDKIEIDEWTELGWMAALYGMIGEKDRALELLEMAYEEREFSLLFLNIDRMYDSLRDDPGFKDLVKRVGLPAKSG